MSVFDLNKHEMENTECPSCERQIITNIPGKYKCKNCGCKFSVDKSKRRTIFKENDEGKLVQYYYPNKIDLPTRVMYFILSFILLIYGTIGLTNNDLFIPGKRSSGVHLHGSAALIMYIAFIFAIFNMISVIVDHYDKRDNEIKYRIFAKIMSITAWILFFTSMIIGFIPYIKT